MKLLYRTLFILFFLVGCSQNDYSSLENYLDEASSFDIQTKFIEGKLDIQIPMVNTDEESVQHETLILILAVKSYPRENTELFKEINLNYIDKNTNDSIAKVKVTGETLMKTDWGNLGSFSDIPKTVDFYNFTLDN